MVAYILFYSKYCKYSRYYIKELEKYRDINKSFQKICIDKVNGQLHDREKQLLKKYKIKGVPSIVINNNVLLGQDAFKWLSSESMTINPVYAGLNKKDYSDTTKHLQEVQPLYSQDLTSHEFSGKLFGESSTDKSDLNDLKNHGNRNTQFYAEKQPDMNNRRPPTPDILKPIDCKAGKIDLDEKMRNMINDRDTY